MNVNLVLLERIKKEPFISDVMERVHPVGLEDFYSFPAEVVLSYISSMNPFSSKPDPQRFCLL